MCFSCMEWRGSGRGWTVQLKGGEAKRDKLQEEVEGPEEEEPTYDSWEEGLSQTGRERGESFFGREPAEKVLLTKTVW